MELKDKYFHSIHSYIKTYDREILFNDILNKMEKIFSCGFILPYKNILELYGNGISRNKIVNLNRDDFISVSLHEFNRKNKMKNPKKNSQFMKMPFKVLYYRNLQLY